jgi:hypothetical protein
MTKILENLRKGALKLDEMRKTLPELDAHCVQWTGEAERLAKLLENIDARVLLQVSPPGKHLPAEDASRLERLDALKVKIALVPGVRANLERRIEAMETELGSDFREAMDFYRDKAKGQFATELTANMERNLPACGGNARRAMLASTAAMEHSEAQLWVNFFSSRESSTDIATRIEKLLERAARFEAGNPVRPKPEAEAKKAGEVS